MTLPTTTSIKASVAAGDIQLYDNYVPNLKGGNYKVNVTQTLSGGTSQSFNTHQRFTVAAPQIAMNKESIINQYPPDGSTGIYGEVLPHIVLKEPMLPWERALAAPATRVTPWLALMVFSGDQLIGGNKKTGSISGTLNDFQTQASPTLVPSITPDADIQTSTPCEYIVMSTDTFTAQVPYVTELPYLAHVRQVNTGGRAELGIDEQGLFSVIASNTFANAPLNNGTTSPKSIKNIVHLVSLEGMEDYLTGSPTWPSSMTQVSLLSLASWSFLSLPNVSEDFRALATNLVNEEETTPGNNTTVDSSKLWLRLPAPTQDTGSAGYSTVQQRIADGYAPLAYHTRSGEDTFAWYRGPLAPILTENSGISSPYFTSDAAIIYDKTNGVFDMSLAAAWQAGREAALADKSFGKNILAYRDKALTLLDKMEEYLASDSFSATDIETLTTSGNLPTIQSEFLKMLTPQLIKDFKINPTPTPYDPAQTTPSSSNVVDDAKSFMTSPGTIEALHKLIVAEFAVIAEWLSDLMLLKPLPFECLVPDSRMLPPESIRFFYIDQNWLNAAVDGAVSLGQESSKTALFTELTRGMLQEAALQSLAISTDASEGVTPGATHTPPAIMSGVLIRSALVTGWPNLVIKPKAATPADTTLKILRMECLSPSVLLCIFDGVPDNIEISQPSESLGFGVDDNGNVVLRDTITAGSLGDQLGAGNSGLKQIRDLTQQSAMCMRSATSLTLNIDPADSSGLVQTLVSGLTALGNTPANSDLSPSTFSIQMIKAAEGLVFTSQTS
ncbi:MAG: hypothetical protein HEP71_33065 [Roseivirga sp.]|nr:hypothetical protein [Roseivirga sp.]